MNHNSAIQENLLRFQTRLKNDPLLFFLNRLTSEYPQARVYLVGGMVRDGLMGRPDSRDFDVVVGGMTPSRLERFLAREGKVILAGKAFGVFKFTPKGADPRQQIDVALPRREHSTFPGGYRDFEVQSDADLPIEEDLSRRDFTVNAMAWDWRTSQLLDPFDGLGDMRSRRIKAVGEPSARFGEDYSRMLRALRFSCQLGYDIESLTWTAVRENMSHINDLRSDRPMERVVPYEVMAKELLKAFWLDAVKAFDLYEASGGFQRLMPELLKMKGCPQPEIYHAEGDVWLHTRMALGNLTSEAFRRQFGDDLPDAELVMAVLFHDIGKPYTIKTPGANGVDRIRFDQHDTVGAGMARKICVNLRLSSQPSEDPLHVDSENMWWLVKNHLLGIRGDIEHMKNRTIEKYFLLDEPLGMKLMQLIFCDGSATISPEGTPTISNFLKIAGRVRELKAIRAEEKFFRPLLNGHDVMRLFGLKSGPRIGDLLELLREEQLSGRVRTRREAIDFVKSQVEQGVFNAK